MSVKENLHVFIPNKKKIVYSKLKIINTISIDIECQKLTFLC